MLCGGARIKYKQVLCGVGLTKDRDINGCLLDVQCISKVRYVYEDRLFVTTLLRVKRWQMGGGGGLRADSQRHLEKT